MKRIIGLLFMIGLPWAASGQLGSDIDKTFETLDVDSNKKIDKEEAREDARLSTSFTFYDSDGDGFITKREYTRFMGPRRPRFPL